MQTIKAVVFWQDGGDGGGSIFIYPDHESLKKALFAPNEWNTQEKMDKRFQSALDGDDPYENGEISNVAIPISPNQDGTFSLAKDVYIHYGQ